MSFDFRGVDLEDDSIEIVHDEAPLKNLQQQNINKQQKKPKNKQEHSKKENNTRLNLVYTLDKDDIRSHLPRKSVRTYSRPKSKHTDTVLLLPNKRARDSDDDVAPVSKKQRAEAQPFLAKLTENFRVPQTEINIPNKATISSEERKRNNNHKRVTVEARDSPKQTTKLGKEGSVFRAGSAHQPLTVSDEMTPVKQTPVKHAPVKHAPVKNKSRDEDSLEVVILNDESPQHEIAPDTFLDMTGEEEKSDKGDNKRGEEQKSSEDDKSSAARDEESSLDQSFDLFDSQPLTASRDHVVGTLPRLALVCVQIDRLVVRDTDVKGEFVLRVKAHHLSVSAVSPSSPPIEIEISELVQVQYSALHRLIVLRLKTVPASLSGFWHHKDRPHVALILAEELSEDHKRHVQSLLAAEKRKLDKYDDRKLKIDLMAEVYEQYIKGRQQGVDLTLSSDHVPLEIHGEIHASDEARDDAEYRTRDSDSPPRSSRILRSSRASVQSAEEIHAEIEHKRANVLCVWPKGARDSVSITELDLARLEPNEFLNDVIIDFYLMWIRDRVVPPKLRNKIYFYNSFFYNLLTRKSQGYGKVKKWTKHVNIFDYDYLVIPINQHFHWRVCIVYHPRLLLTSSEESKSDAPYLVMLDSLQGSAGSVYRAIREYLQKEWQDKQHESDVSLDLSRLKTIMPKAPTQDNHYDCGIFVLQYVESFCTNPVKSPSHITASWFSEKVIARKRREIRAIILKLAEEQGHPTSNMTNHDSNGKDSQD